MNLVLLTGVTEEFAAYLSEVTDGDLTACTPCALWTIEDLYTHMLDINNTLSGRPAPVDGCVLRETVYRASARQAVDALTGGADPRFEAHLTNTLIHTWDLARAMHIDFDRPGPAAIDVALRYLQGLPPESRGSFAEPLDHPAAAPMDEVLFLSGRAPA